MPSTPCKAVPLSFTAGWCIQGSYAHAICVHEHIVSAALQSIQGRTCLFTFVSGPTLPYHYHLSSLLSPSLLFPSLLCSSLLGVSGSDQEPTVDQIVDVVVDAYANDERKANPVLKRNDGLEVDAGVVFAGLVNENTDVIWTI